ncbi:MAG: 4Fe-4S binding protein [Clostridia bacterium]|jgi:ferredoxin|nr:4Fe-4S binding protein [Clostridiaceae bacterium]
MKKIKITFEFPPNSIKQPLTYRLIKDFDLMLNILSADVSLNRTGRLTMDMQGEEDMLEAALDWVKKQGISFKIFEKEVIWNEDKCIHCGACTAVCPSGALSLDNETWKLTFDREKCLICELCIQTCPLGVMGLNGDNASLDT